MKLTLHLIWVLCLGTGLALVHGQALPAPLPEKNIYIPYERLWETFEQEKRGVFLPYDEFQKLWQRAHGGVAGVEPALPVASAVAEVRGQLQVGADSASGHMQVQVALMQKGWSLLPLRLQGCAVTSYSGSAPLIYAEKSGYMLLLRHVSGEPESSECRIEFAVPLQKRPGRNTLHFESPPAPVNLWTIGLEEADVSVTAVGDGTVCRPETGVAGRYQLNLGSDSVVHLEWTPRLSQATGLPAVVNVDSRLEYQIDGGALRCGGLLSCTVDRSPLSRMTLQLPPGMRVVQVSDDNIRQWRQEAAGSGPLLHLDFYEGVQGRQEIRLEMETALSAGAPLQLLPLVVLGASRQTGLIRLMAGEGVRVEVVEREGLRQVDGKESGEGGGVAAVAAFRYSGIPWRLVGRVGLVQPQISAQGRHDFRLRPEQMAVRSRFSLEARGAGFFQTELELPGGWELQRTQALAADGTDILKEAVRVADKPSLLRLIFRQKSQAVQIVVELTRELGEAGVALSQPGQDWVELAFQPVRISDAYCRQESGHLLVSSHPGLTLEKRESRGLRELQLADVPPAEPERGDAGSGRLWGFHYASGEPWPQLTVAARRRPAQVTVGQLQVLAVEDGRQLQTRLDWHIEVLYSGRRELRLALPEVLAGRVQVESAGYRLTADTAGADEGLPAGYLPYRLQGPREFFGVVVVRMSWREELASVPVGEGTVLACQRLIPLQVDRSWGQIVLLKSETLELAVAQAENVLPIDPRFDLKLGEARPDAALALEYHDRWSLQLRATRFENAVVKSTSIERGVVTLVRTNDGALSVQAVYRLRSQRQRLAVELPAAAQFDNQPARLGHVSVPLEKGSGGQYYIPLAGQRQGEAMLLELRYVLPAGGCRLSVPAFPEDTAVQQIALSVYLPVNRVVLGMRGPWNPDNVWVVRGALDVYPRARQGQPELYAWLQAESGLPAAHFAGLSNFVVEGRQLLYKALRPEGGEAGALRLTVWPRLPVKGGLFGLILLVALLLLRASLRCKLAVMTAALGAVGAGTIFLPSLTYASLSNASALAAVLAGCLWLLASLSGWGCRPPAGGLSSGGSPLSAGAAEASGSSSRS